MTNARGVGGSSVRAEALSWPLVRAEVPFFQPQQDSPHGDYLEGAMDLLGVESLDICPWALREGVILDELDALRRTPTPS